MLFWLFISRSSSRRERERERERWMTSAWPWNWVQLFLIPSPVCTWRAKANGAEREMKNDLEINEHLGLRRKLFVRLLRIFFGVCTSSHHHRLHFVFSVAQHAKFIHLLSDGRDFTSSANSQKVSRPDGDYNCRNALSRNLGSRAAWSNQPKLNEKSCSSWVTRRLGCQPQNESVELRTESQKCHLHKIQNLFILTRSHSKQKLHKRNNSLPRTGNAIES